MRAPHDAAAASCYSARMTMQADILTAPATDAPRAPDARSSDSRISLAGLTREALAEKLGTVGVPQRELRMRVGQIWQWLYGRGATDFDSMSNVSKGLRALLAEHFTLARPEVVSEQISRDGTRKWLLRMAPTGPLDRGAEVEAVYIPEADRGTLCVSSQVGCTLNCTFCHTGTQKLVRNLSAAEIVGQLLVARDRLRDYPGQQAERETRLVTNVVFMGMGEPLYNLDNARDAIAVMSDAEGLQLSRRRITVSTSGVVP